MSVKYDSEPSILVDLRNDFPAIRDQGPRPLCLAFATSDLNSFIHNEDEAFSVEYLSYYSYKEAGITDYTKGLTVLSVKKAIEIHGQPPEYVAPYDELATKPLLPSGTYNELFYAKGDDGNDLVGELVESLDKKNAVTIGVNLNPMFFNPIDSCVIDDEIGDLGCHALIVVGYGSYSGGEHCFLIRNSWGESWANNGYAWLTSKFITNRVFMSLRLSKIS